CQSPQPLRRSMKDDEASPRRLPEHPCVLRCEPALLIERSKYARYELLLLSVRRALCRVLHASPRPPSSCLLNRAMWNSDLRASLHLPKGPGTDNDRLRPGGGRARTPSRAARPERSSLDVRHPKQRPHRPLSSRPSPPAPDPSIRE